MTIPWDDTVCPGSQTKVSPIEFPTLDEFGTTMRSQIGDCPICGKRYALRSDGALWKHHRTVQAVRDERTLMNGDDEVINDALNDPVYIVEAPERIVSGWIVVGVSLFVAGVTFGLGFLVALWTGVTC